VPLSEHEQRLLEQMEQAMYAEDPKFASNMRGRSSRARQRRRYLFGGIGLLVGLVLVVVGVAKSAVPLAVVGFVLALVVLIFVCAFGGHEFRAKEVAVLTVVLIIFSVLVFVKGLTLPFPLWPDFMS